MKQATMIKRIVYKLDTFHTIRIDSSYSINKYFLNEYHLS